MTLFRALRHRNFACLWIGQTLSRLGDYVYQIALAWWVLQKTGSAAQMGLVLIFAITPSVLFALLGGAAGDRFSRPRLMLASDLARGLVVLIVAALAFANHLQVWQVLTASLIFGFVEAFFQPAYVALVPQIVPADDLPSANSLTSLSTNLGRIGGPGVGAALVAGLGPAAAFGLNGASFLVSALFLFPLLRVTVPRPERDPRAAGLWREIREGLTTVRALPILWVSIAVSSLANITLAGPFSVAMPFLVNRNMRADVATLGLLYSIFPLGYVIGGVWLGRYRKIRRRGPLMFGATIVAALLLGLFGLLPPIPVLMAAALVNGFALELEHLIWTNILQQTVPNEQLGRVTSIDALGSFGLLPLGLALAGWATEALGAPAVFMLGGGLTAMLSLAALTHPAIRGLD